METIADIRNLPELTEDAVHIWGVHVPQVRDRLDVLHDLLCTEEQEKAARFRRDSDRHSSIAARGALRILLGGYTGIPAAEIGFRYSENGKPFLVPPVSSRFVPQAGRLLPADPPGRRDACGTGQGRQDAGASVAFNVSHSGEWVVLAIGRNRNIGVDIEMIKHETDVLPIASRYFTPEESQLIQDAEDPHAVFFSLWARKEAYVKAAGSALFRELSTFAVPFVDGQKDGWFFQRLEAGSKYAAAVVTDKPVAGLPCYDFQGLELPADI